MKNRLVPSIWKDRRFGVDIAEIDVTVGKLKCDIAPDLVGETGMQRPREIPFAGGGAKGVAAAVAGAEQPSIQVEKSPKLLIVLRLKPTPAPTNGVMFHQVPRSTWPLNMKVHSDLLAV